MPGLSFFRVTGWGGARTSSSDLPGRMRSNMARSTVGSLSKADEALPMPGISAGGAEGADGTNTGSDAADSASKPGGVEPACRRRPPPSMDPVGAAVSS